MSLGRRSEKASPSVSYSRPLSMEEAFDRVLHLERALADERAERQRIERELEEQRMAHQTLEREIDGRLRGIEIAASSASGWKEELADVREEMSTSGDSSQKQLDDHKDSLNAILEVLEDTVTHEHMDAAVAAVRGEVLEHSSSNDLVEAVTELDERLGGLSQHLESVVDEIGVTEGDLSKRLAKCESDAVAAVDATKDIDATINHAVQKFDAKSAQLDKLVEGHVEEELRGFAQSFRLAVSRIDLVVQQLDKKIEQSVGSIATRLSEENNLLDEQIGRVAKTVEDALLEAQHRLENLAADIQQFILQVGSDKVAGDQVATSTAARVEDLQVGISRLKIEVEETEIKLRGEMQRGDNAVRGEIQAARLSDHTLALATKGSELGS